MKCNRCKKEVIMVYLSQAWLKKYGRDAMRWDEAEEPPEYLCEACYDEEVKSMGIIFLNQMIAMQ